MADSVDPDLDNIAAEVAEDIAAGQGEKHFQDLFDGIANATPEREPPEVRERINRFMLEFASGINDRLRGNEHGFTCLAVNRDGHGDGFICKFRDAGGRPFTAECSFEDGFRAAAQYGQENMGKAMMASVIERIIAARVAYFKRMESMH